MTKSASPNGLSITCALRSRRNWLSSIGCWEQKRFQRRSRAAENGRFTGMLIGRKEEREIHKPAAPQKTVMEMMVMSRRVVWVFKVIDGTEFRVWVATTKLQPRDHRATDGGRRHLSPNETSIPRARRCILLERNDEWAVQRARDMTRETLTGCSNPPCLSSARGGSPRTVAPTRTHRQVEEPHHVMGHDPAAVAAGVARDRRGLHSCRAATPAGTHQKKYCSATPSSFQSLLSIRRLRSSARRAIAWYSCHCWPSTTLRCAVAMPSTGSSALASNCSCQFAAGCASNPSCGPRPRVCPRSSAPLTSKCASAKP